MPGPTRQSVGSPQDVLDKEDMTDDTDGHIPITGLTNHLTLRGRFIDRLSRMTAAQARLSDDKKIDTVDIYMTRNPGSPQSRIDQDSELKRFLQDIERSLSVISEHPSGPRFNGAEMDLWDSILEYAYLNVDHVIESIKRSFQDNHDVFQDFVARYLGLDAVDAKTPKVDDKLDELIFELHQKAFGYDRSMKQLNELIFFANSMIQSIDFLHAKLKGLFHRTRFANELYRLICTLGLPKRANDTFMTAAKHNPAFKGLTFHLVVSIVSPRRVRFVNPATSASSKSSKRPLRTSRRSHTAPRGSAMTAVTTKALATVKPHETAANTSTTLSSSPASSIDETYQGPKSPPPVDEQTPSDEELPMTVVPPLTIDQRSDMVDVVRPYLAMTDLAAADRAQQDTAHLVGQVLRCQLLPIHFNAWYSFGFVTTQYIEQERQLAELYASIFREAQTPTTIYREVVRGLKTNTIVNLFDIKEYAHFRKLFPGLESFLRTPPAKRSSVWRLIQYLKLDDYMEPAAVLKRDFGFQFCRMHYEVDVLKTIYTRLLAKCTPKELHEACKHGRIIELTLQKGVHVDSKHRFLLKNDYGYPGVGFDNEVGLQRHRAPLFKRTPKM